MARRPGFPGEVGVWALACLVAIACTTERRADAPPQADVAASPSGRSLPPADGPAPPATPPLGPGPTRPSEPGVSTPPNPSPEPTTQSPAATSVWLDDAFHERARRLCSRGKPDDLYRVTARVDASQEAALRTGAHLVLVVYRELDGSTRPTPKLEQGYVYDLRFDTPAPKFRVEFTSEVDVIACLALRATARELWESTTGLIQQHTIDAADAILWMVDPESGELVGRPWLRRPPAPGSGRNWILFGDGGPGIRPPVEADIVKDIERFLGL